MTRTVVVGLLLFLLFAVAFAPASLLRTLLPKDSGLEVLEPRGTLWDGAADLYLAGQPAGRLAFDFAAGALLRGALGYDVALTGPDHALTGSIALGPGSAEATLQGRAAAAFANQWLTAYDISISGEVTFREAHVRIPYDYAETGAGSSAGSLTWSGGPVRYVLSGRSYAGDLPPLVAYLGEGLETVVVPANGQTPLLRAEVLANGFVRVGMTKLLTRMVGNPWPGAHADHEVVLEVEEQLF